MSTTKISNRKFDNIWRVGCGKVLNKIKIYCSVLPSIKYSTRIFFLSWRNTATTCRHQRRHYMWGFVTGFSQSRVRHSPVETLRLHKSGLLWMSNSPWALEAVSVKKKTGDLTICIDYRPLTIRTRKHAYPLLRIDEALEAL